MIKFFRRIRYNQINQERVGKYLLYAVGEIILVVIGILIAVQVNNSNIEKKNHSLKKIYIEALISDLVQDSIQLSEQIQIMTRDLELMQSFSDRLSHPQATMDSVIRISRYEFLGRFNPDNNLNQNTINSLISSNDLNLFDLEFRNFLLEHKKTQETTLKIIEDNFQIYLQTLYVNDRAPVDRPSLATSAIKGALLDRIWDNFDMANHLYAFNKVLTNKIVMQMIVLHFRRELIEKTSECIQKLKSYQLE